jgi:endonuclease/exonuclease/phosphatase family metal-dependent hydrolase
MRLLPVLAACFLMFSLPISVLAESESLHADNYRQPSTSFSVDVGREKQATAMELALKQAAPSKGLKVLWWNVASGNLASDGTSNSITQNIISLLHSGAAPDVMVFGEFGASALDAEALAALAHTHPYKTFLPYSKLQLNLGIGVYSRLPFTLGRGHVLNWMPVGSAASNQKYVSRWSAGLEPNAEAFYARTVREIIVNTSSGPVAIVPVHLSEPWRSIKVRYGSTLGAAKIVDEMFLGKNNPIINQIRDLVKWLPAGGPQQKIVIGDFNMPTGFFSMPTTGFKILSQSLRPADIGLDSTFPTQISPVKKKYPPVQIDHAFTSGSLRAEAGMVLPFTGSDHYPIYSIFH